MGFEDLDNDEGADQRHENRIKRCRDCNAKIIWFTTPTGRRMPVDEDTVEAGQYELDLSKHRSHFATCPSADKFRKPR